LLLAVVPVVVHIMVLAVVQEEFAPVSPALCLLLLTLKL
jgi:hypothetical protein